MNLMNLKNLMCIIYIILINYDKKIFYFKKAFKKNCRGGRFRYMTDLHEAGASDISEAL